MDMDAHVIIVANDEWLTVKFTPDLETNWPVVFLGEDKEKGRCRRNAREEIKETTFNPSLHPGDDYNTKRQRHGPLRSALT